MLVLGEATDDALMRLAAREDRTPRHQAERLLREALIRSGDLAPDARPCDRPEYAGVPASNGAS